MGYMTESERAAEAKERERYRSTVLFTMKLGIRECVFIGIQQEVFYPVELCVWGNMVSRVWAMDNVEDAGWAELTP